MTAYLVMEIDSVEDVEEFARYRDAATPIVARWGGRFLARVVPAEALEGNWGRVAISEFPSLDAARGFYNSAEYQEVAALRQRSAQSRLLLIGSPDEIA